MRIYNTINRKIEEFEPLHPPLVTLYTCGPTVYDFAHIGNLRTYTNNDLLKRTLTFLGYKVKHVMNTTDVGHLTGDDDTGEDKMEKGAKKSGKNVWDVARFYTDFFIKSIKDMNILLPDYLTPVTEHINEIIELIKILEKKGFTYETDEALYFDVSKFPKYGALSGQKLEDKIKGAREEVYVDPNKKNPADFALWLKRVGRFQNHTMHWNSPWGDGFPGWHIECSAISMKYLGETIDIHAGGVEHIPVHHENEIAQSEAATDKPFVRYWFHNELLKVDGKKMSKSLGNFYTLVDLEKKGIEPLSLRYLYLQTHYRKQLNFTDESIQSAQDTYNKLKEQVKALRSQNQRTVLSEDKLEQVDIYRDRFNEAIANDLQIPQAVAVMWEMLKSNIPSTDKCDSLYEFDQVLGLKLSEIEEEKIPDEIIQLVKDRENARKKGDYNLSDSIRDQLLEKGYIIEDTKSGFKVRKMK